MEEQGQEVEIISAEEAKLIPVEANLEIPPLFQMRRTDPNNRLAECWVHAVTLGGERLEQYWRVSVPEPWELPGPFDQDVWVAMQTLVNRKGGMRGDGRVSFSMYELLEIMDKPATGRNYAELKNALLRLSSVHIYSGKAFYSKDIDDYEDRGFGLWDVTFRKRVIKGSSEESERHEVEFHSMVRRSFQAGYLKALDADFYYSLGSRYAKRLYRLIDRKRQENISWTVSVDRLRQLLPLPSTYKSPSKIKDVLKPAHRELQERGFLSEAGFEKGKHPKYRYRVNPSFAKSRRLQELPQPSLFSSTQPEVSTPASPQSEAEVRRRLRDKGVWPNVASKLVTRGVDLCMEALAALPHQNGIQSEAKWLKWAIETGDFEITAKEKVSNGTDNSTNTGAEDAMVSALGTSSKVESRGPVESPAPDTQSLRVWKQVLESAVEETDSPTLKGWFEGTFPTAIQNGTLTLSVPNSVAKEYIETRFLATLERVLGEYLGTEGKIEIEARE